MKTDQLPIPESSVLAANPQSRIVSVTERSTSLLARGAASKVGRKVLAAYISLNKKIWNRLPAWLPPNSHSAYGRHLHAIARLQADRKQYFATFFLRNRPELELMRRLVAGRSRKHRLNVAVLACSKGAEVYSIAWTLRTAFPDLELNIRAVDISREIVEFAAKGVYSFAGVDSADKSNPQVVLKNPNVNWNTGRDQNAWIFERMTNDEIEAMFTIEGDLAKIRSYLQEGITWSCGDAGDTELVRDFGPQDIVVANRFLCHMSPPKAAACLRNIGKMVNTGGYLFVSGIDLAVRTQVALEMGWQPVQDLLKEIHDGDDSIRRGWPVEYWGVEPLEERRPDWQTRYASVFKIGE
jgi:chemotaxis methyl-accepting protein methylase